MAKVWPDFVSSSWERSAGAQGTSLGSCVGVPQSQLEKWPLGCPLLVGLVVSMPRRIWLALRKVLAQPSNAPLPELPSCFGSSRAVSVSQPVEITSCWAWPCRGQLMAFSGLSQESLHMECLV